MDDDTSQSLPWIVLALPLSDQLRRAASKAAAGNSRVSRDAHRETCPCPPRCFCHQQTVTKLLLERAPSTPASESSQCFQTGVVLTRLSSTPSSEVWTWKYIKPLLPDERKQFACPSAAQARGRWGSSSPGTAQPSSSPCTLPVLLQLQHLQPFPAFASVPFPEGPAALTQLVAPAGHVPMSPEVGPWLPLVPPRAAVPTSSSQQCFLCLEEHSLQAGL